MGKKPNAANITHGLAQLGGGSKKAGGGGMMKGIENVFMAGGNNAIRQMMGGDQSTRRLPVPSIFWLGSRKGRK